MTRYSQDWKPTLEKEEILLSGKWYQQGKHEYKAELVRQKFNYTSFDIDDIEECVHGELLDYISYAISDNGLLYFWRFTNAADTFTSAEFGTFYSAKDHINTYDGRCEF